MGERFFSSINRSWLMHCSVEYKGKHSSTRAQPQDGKSGGDCDDPVWLSLLMILSPADNCYCLHWLRPSIRLQMSFGRCTMVGLPRPAAFFSHCKTWTGFRRGLLNWAEAEVQVMIDW